MKKIESLDISDEFQKKLIFLSECKLEDYELGVSIIVNSQFIYMNRTSKEIFEITDVCEKYFSMYDFISSEDANRFHKLRKKVLKDKQLPSSFSCWIVCKSGVRKYITNRYIALSRTGNPTDRIVVTIVNSGIKTLNQSLYEFELKCYDFLGKYSAGDISNKKSNLFTKWGIIVE